MCIETLICYKKLNISVEVCKRYLEVNIIACLGNLHLSFVEFLFRKA